MLAQTIPGQEHSSDSNHGMINFVTGRKNLEEEVKKQNCYENKVDVEIETENLSPIDIRTI